MDWVNLIADVEKILPCHYTAGRDAIKGVTAHHMAGNLTIDGCYSTWASREASAHYAVQADGKIGQLVNDWDTAWACNNDWANRNTISIEHANNGSNPWTIYPAALDAGAHLVAAICLKYGLGEPKWMVNVFPHKHWSATQCPGELAGSQNAEYMEKAKRYYAELAGEDYEPPQAASAPSSTPASTSTVPAIMLQAQTTDGTVLPWTTHPDYAGWDANGPIAYLCARCEWPLEVQAYAGGRWWPAITNPSDITDKANGCVGDGSPITGLRMYLHSPDGDKVVAYQVGTGGEAYYPEQRDHETSGGQDGYAGDLARPVYRVKARIADY